MMRLPEILPTYTIRDKEHAMTVSRRQKVRAAVAGMSSGIMIGIIGVIILSALFIKLADDVVEREFYNFDRSIALAIHSTTSDTQTAIMKVITNFGSPYLIVLAILSLFIGLVIAWRSRHPERSGIIVAVMDVTSPSFTLVGAFLLVTLIKHIIGRSRPDLFPPLVHEIGYSFPSGHAISSVAFYGMSAYLLARSASIWLRLLIITLAVLLVGAIMYSRVYLGVHYPTDVLGSMLLGLAWLISVIIGLHIAEQYLVAMHREDRQQKTGEAGTAQTASID
jgi:membrane-associated phospholipid phosphatase